MKLKSEEEDNVLNDDNDNRSAFGYKYDNVFAGGHSAPCAENAIINVKVIGASQEMSSYLPLPSKSCQYPKGGAGRSETLEHRRSPTDISKRLQSSEK